MPRMNWRHGLIVVLLGLIPGIVAYNTIRERRQSAAWLAMEQARGERGLRSARVAMLGDSITSQGDDWSARLGVPVANLGISGAQSDAMLRQAESLPATVDTVLVMGGINDLRAKVPVATVVKNIGAVLTRLGTRRTFLQSVLVTADERTNRNVVALNAQLRDLCKADKCRFVDLNPVVAPTGHLTAELTRDGLHLSETAYTRWARQIAPLVKRTKTATN